VSTRERQRATEEGKRRRAVRVPKQEEERSEKDVQSRKEGGSKGSQKWKRGEQDIWQDKKRGGAGVSHQRVTADVLLFCLLPVVVVVGE
jgi:hypothetical protein